MKTILVWLRHDLRLRDNPALWHAVADSQRVIPVYILDESMPWPYGGAQRWWLHHSLHALSESLLRDHVSLILKRGAAHQLLPALVEQYQADAVYWNRCYEPAAIARDTQIKTQLQQQGITVHSFNASLLHEPWQITTKSGGTFRVFTPYWKACCAQLTPRTPYPKAVCLPFVTHDSDNLSSWQLLPDKPDWAQGLRETWRVGETAAMQRLEHFIDQHLTYYATHRDIPAVCHTSLLSPHLHFGEISVWQIWHALQQVLAHRAELTKPSEKFLAELGWREFSYQLLYHFPALPTQNFHAHFDNFAWHSDPFALAAWQQGHTGYPIIDAGMRELWHTGYMHNRVRMLAASFLTKHLLQHWSAGARWFWDTLVDADLANNSASWQWVAGSGADAAPYFRIFNPILQSEKFDPDGTYIKRWLPELAALPSAYLHQPWQAPTNVLKQAGIVLDKHYPQPLIAHDVARKRALDAYARLRAC